MTKLLAEGRACYSEPVFMELIAGARGKAGLRDLERNFVALPMIKVGQKEWDRARDIAIALRLKDKRVGIVDLLVAAVTITNDAQLFHHDNHFRIISSVAPLREYSLLT